MKSLNNKIYEYLNFPVFVTGLPRSGTSMTAGVLSNLGFFTGPTVPGGDANPKGFFENIIIREKIIKGILRAGKFCPLGVKSLPPLNFYKKINFENSKSLKEVLLQIITKQGYKNHEPWLIKDAKLTLMWRIFNDQFPDAIWLVVNRNRENFIRSCLKTDFMFQHSDQKKFWNNFADEYEQRLEELIKNVKNSIQINTDELVKGNYDQIKLICDKLNISFNKKKINDFISPQYWNR
tara:strand:- start:81 stop:788 length:708 start_codon:yes stop_codon:yes gene_type:complete